MLGHKSTRAGDLHPWAPPSGMPTTPGKQAAGQ